VAAEHPPVPLAPVAIGALGGVEGLEVELVDRLGHEPGEVVLVQEVRREKIGWSRSQLREFWGMAASSACKWTQMLASGDTLTRGQRRRNALRRSPLRGESRLR
jgi:hypothetical protein